MVRELLGNIRGPQGPQGSPGEGLENNTMGSENLFSMSREKWRYSGNIADYDYNNGIIKFSNTIYQFRYEIHLRAGTHTASVDDVINPQRTGFENTITLQLYDSNENNMRTIGIVGGPGSEHPNTRNFEITESEETQNDGVFHIQIAIANSGRHTGEIRGLQVVRGELCPVWGLSAEDSIMGRKPQLMISSPYIQPVPGERTPLNLHHSREHDDLTNPNNNEEIILSKGVWDFNWNFTMRSHADGEQAITRINMNGVLFLATKTESNHTTTISTKIVANEGDTLEITQEVPVGSDFQIDRSVTQYSRMTLYKIGGHV